MEHNGFYSLQVYQGIGRRQNWSGWDHSFLFCFDPKDV